MSSAPLRLATAAAIAVGLLLAAPGPPALAEAPATATRASASAMLESVVAVSKSDAWAVGSVVEHWDGRKWTVVPGARTRKCAVFLNGVAARSPSSAWAVGLCGTTGSHRPIIERWNGHYWSVQPSPSAPASAVSQLNSVTATSGSNAWAVGEYLSNGRIIPLIERWNGRAWKIQASPDPSPHGAELGGVTALSASSAWAAGAVLSGPSSQPQSLIEHWNGHRWHTQPSVNPGTQNALEGITALTGTQAWTAGLYTFGPTDIGTLVENWDGASWQEQATPGTDLHEGLFDIAARSASDVWAVGARELLTNSRTLVLHWNGTTWRIVPSPSPSAGQDELLGVAVLSSAYAWAVGNQGDKTLIERWNGTAWTVQPSPN